MAGFLQRLKRRKLVQWGLAYVAFAFALLQGVDIVANQFDWPDGVRRGITLALTLGFLVTLVLAWYHGERGAQQVSGAELLLIALVLAVGGGLMWRLVPAPSAGPGVDAAPVPVPLAVPVPGKSIAVLPFESLSADKSNAYFVSGMQDMILTSLSKLEGLKVISRTSTERYASRPENLRQVGAELGVATILEGSVQREGDRVLINLQLIDARSDAHLWAEVYEREVADVFSVEREVAAAVASALRAKLMPTEVAHMGRAPTDDPAAYDLYLRGEYEAHQFVASNDDGDIRDAIAHYEQAVAADPRFALAFARLAHARLLLYWSGNDSAPDRSTAAAARDAAAIGLRLAPDMPEVGLAMAEIKYRLDLDFPGALAAFDAVLAQRPQSVDALSGKAQVLRRLGRFDESIAAFSAAMAVDPRDSAPSTDRGITRFMAGDLDGAEADLKRSLHMNPADNYAAAYLSYLLMFRDGDPGTALDAIQGGSQYIAAVRIQALTFQRRYADALAVADVPGATGGGAGMASVVFRAQALDYMGKRDAARRLLLPNMQEYHREIEALPANSSSSQAARITLASADALVGNENEALRLTRQALQLLPPGKDAAGGSYGLGLAARVYGQLGRIDLLLPVLARIRALEGTDTLTSAAILRLDPVWDKVRVDPRFQAEIARFAEKQAAMEKRNAG